MAQLFDFNIIRFNECAVIGKIKRIQYKEFEGDTIASFWRECVESDIFDSIAAAQTEGFEFSYAGYMYGFGEEYFHYLAGMKTVVNVKNPDSERFAKMFISQSNAAYALIKGRDSEAPAEAHAFTIGEIKRRGYKLSPYNFWCMEVYDSERFFTYDSNGEVIIDYYIPVAE